MTSIAPWFARREIEEGADDVVSFLRWFHSRREGIPTKMDLPHFCSH
jgi:hypothetical protein